ncbi:MAG: solute carrier family 23 protein [Terriglobales bacterium]
MPVPNSSNVVPLFARRLQRWRDWRSPIALPGRKKPAYLIYDVDEIPPMGIQIAAATQHLFAMSVGWIYVVLVVSAVGGTSAEAQSLIRMSMIASGIATIVQARRGFGNGYLCPLTCSLTYLPPVIAAGLAGGYSLMFGMLLVAGIAAMGVAPVVHRLRVLFPPEVTGLMVAMSGLQLVALGCVRFFGYSKANPVPDPRALTVGVVTLFAMIIPTIWTRSKLHLFPMLIGVAAGYATAAFAGELHSSQLMAQMPAAFVSFPQRAASGLSFKLALLPAFLIAALTASLKTVGDTTLCQKANDSGWKRTDMGSVSGGVFANGLASAISGVLGGIGQNTSSSCIGISLAAGTTSRAIALPLGLLVSALAFFPKAATVVAALPSPAIGAVLIYSACFITMGGLQLLTSRMLDARRIFAVGIALIFGLSVEIVPDIYRTMPGVLKPIFSSSTSVATVLVVILSLLFRVGLKKHRSLKLQAGRDHFDAITQFMDDQGSAWGMRKEIVTRSTDAAYEVVNSLSLLPLRSPDITLQTSWDELRLDLEIEYAGPTIEIADSMPAVEELGTQAGSAQLAGYLIRQYADRVRIREKNGICRVQLHFNH